MFIFSPYCLDPEKRRLSRGGEPVALTPKEFDTLLVLVEASGRVVEREELISRVWPDSYVGDGSLARNISVLRKTLGEEVIETLPRRGYRLTLPVVSGPAEERPPQSEPGPVVEGGHMPRDVAAVIPRAHLWKDKIFAGSVITSALLLSFVVFSFFAIKTAKAHHSAASANPIHSIVIAKSGAIDPLDEGFKLAAPDGNYTHVMRNLENSGFDRWKLITRDQNFYYRAFSDAEKDFVVQKDWTLTCVCALEKGAGTSDIDLGPGNGPRFDIVYLQEGTKYYVALTTQISPGYQFEGKTEFPGVGDVDHPHTYQLRYDHVTRTASLWIDGRLIFSGYRGHHQFQENYGLMFGGAIYRDATESSVVFRSVRFEAN